MSQVFSPSAVMVNSVNNKFAAPQSENIAHKGGRVFTRAVADTVLAPVAIIETIVFAILTAITSPFALNSKTKPVFEFAKQHTITAANASKNAFAGIVGRGVDAKAAPKGKFEKAKQKAAELFAQLQGLAIKGYNKTEQKHVIGAISLAAIAYLGYQYGVVGKAYNLGASGLGLVGDGLSSGFESAKNIVSSGFEGAKDIVRPIAPEFVKSGYHSVADGMSGVYNYFFGPKA